MHALFSTHACTGVLNIYASDIARQGHVCVMVMFASAACGAIRDRLVPVPVPLLSKNQKSDRRSLASHNAFSSSCAMSRFSMLFFACACFCVRAFAMYVLPLTASLSATMSWPSITSCTMCVAMWLVQLYPARRDLKSHRGDRDILIISKSVGIRAQEALRTFAV